MLAITLQTPSVAQQQYRWLSASLRLGKKPILTSWGTTLATHMYIFKCCLKPTSGCECVWNRIRTYGAAKPHGRLTACCLKPLGHPNILAGMVGLAPTVLGLTGRCCILLKLHPNVVDAIGFEPMFFYCHSSQSPEDSLHASI